ncbi:MAG: sigma-54-dependent transcriptional regulator [Thermodesulfobacteriota bacterium]
MAQKRILIVDDEPIVLKSLQWGLSEQGYAVECAESGEEGLARLEQDSYHLLISDLLMEGMDGIELIKRAKALYPDMAVCLLTGYADLSSAIEALRLGADDYLMKPCEPTELFMRVERALAREDLRKRVRYFENILPVCAVCKKIRDDTGKEPGEGEWVELEQYLRRKTGISINQVCCEQCAQKKNQEDADSSNIG